MKDVYSAFLFDYSARRKVVKDGRSRSKCESIRLPWDANRQHIKVRGQLRGKWIALTRFTKHSRRNGFFYGHHFKHLEFGLLSTQIGKSIDCSWKEPLIIGYGLIFLFKNELKTRKKTNCRLPRMQQEQHFFTAPKYPVKVSDGFSFKYKSAPWSISIY